MKKKFLGILLTGMCFFGGFGIAGAYTGANGVDQMGPPASSSSDLSTTFFTLDPGKFSPSTKVYDKGTKGNFDQLLANIGKYLLIATSTMAVLSITIGGIMIATTGPSDRAAKGKTIISLNIMAILIALFSYSIIQIVRWVLTV